ncbi:MAG: hypothetical protein FWH44_04985 [Methanomassiliicoccaceae archaeon]|nr:hypothetical protein [Methanomassiliicoccaceae archaeon]
MSESSLTVDAGVCRFKTNIHAVSDDMMSVALTIESECPNVKKLASELKTADVMDAVASRITDNGVMKVCSNFIPHPACPVPCAIIKACEVAADLGLRRNVTFTFE